MSDDKQKPTDNEFLQAAGQEERGLIAEFVAFMAENKMWWLTPILIVFLLLGVLLILGATGVAPFLYSFA
ncbi:MAG: DUF5989 family protein [Planctomycetes bacterium]|jgi:hypothetical protein|nr:DUF5989 family protein [Planctomycetota bacterium]